MNTGEMGMNYENNMGSYNIVQKTPSNSSHSRMEIQQQQLQPNVLEINHNYPIQNGMMYDANQPQTVNYPTPQIKGEVK